LTKNFLGSDFRFLKLSPQYLQSVPLKLWRLITRLSLYAYSDDYIDKLGPYAPLCYHGEMVHNEGKYLKRSLSADAVYVEPNDLYKPTTFETVTVDGKNKPLLQGHLSRNLTYDVFSGVIDQSIILTHNL